MEAHAALTDNGLRDVVELRTDGGLFTGKDVLLAALLGAEGFDFGKLLLVAKGCIMARICEKNTCPTGIATHDPKFKSKYRGSPDHVKRVLRAVAGAPGAPMCINPDDAHDARLDVKRPHTIEKLI